MHSRSFLLRGLLLAGGIAFGAFAAVDAYATTSPYVTDVQADVPLDQAADDTVNGSVPFYSGQAYTPPEPGSIALMSDATSAGGPAENVIVGPDNTTVHVAWDLGDPGEGMMWRLERIDIWITAADELRYGFDGSFSVSSTGDAGDFTDIPNSLHVEAGAEGDSVLTQNNNLNYLRYDFPAEYVPGEDPGGSEDRHPVEGFRYLRLNSRGAQVVPSGTRWHPRYVEIDIWATPVPNPNAGEHGTFIELSKAVPSSDEPGLRRGPFELAGPDA